MQNLTQFSVAPKKVCRLRVHHLSILQHFVRCLEPNLQVDLVSHYIPDNLIVLITVTCLVMILWHIQLGKKNAE